MVTEVSKSLNITEPPDSLSYDLMDYCENNSYGTLAVFNISMTWLGLISGGFLVLLICKNPALRGDKFLLLNNLIGAAMVLLAITGIVYTEEAINPCWHVGHFICKIFLFSKTLLANVSTFLLVSMSIQQLNRYRRKPDTVFNATHTRWLITVIAIWAVAVIISIPELVISRVLMYDTEGLLSFCGEFKTNTFQRVASSAKILFLEYITPFLILAVTVVITGVYVFLVRSQYTTFGVTTGESLVPCDLDQPKHFTMIVVMAVVYILGYFPMYSYELAYFLAGVFHPNHINPFWQNIDLVTIFFVLVPPALVPLIVMICSWPHRDAVKAVYRSTTVDIFNGKGQGTAGDAVQDR